MKTSAAGIYIGLTYVCRLCERPAYLKRVKCGDHLRQNDMEMMLKSGKKFQIKQNKTQHLILALEAINENIYDSLLSKLSKSLHIYI